MKHYQVSYEGGNYHFGLVTFPNLEEFLNHFDNQPLIGGEAGEGCLGNHNIHGDSVIMLGTIVVLKHPYFRDISEPDIYETATVHTVIGPTDSQEGDLHCPTAVSELLVLPYGRLYVRGPNFCEICKSPHHVPHASEVDLLFAKFWTCNVYLQGICCVVMTPYMV